MKFKINAIIFIYFWIFFSSCYAEDILFIDNGTRSQSLDNKLELASRFYGLDVKRMLVNENDNYKAVEKIIKEVNPSAIIIDAGALSHKKASKILPSLNELGKKGIPIMILDITPHTSSSELIRWSDGAVTGYGSSTNILSKGLYIFADSKEIARQLAGQSIPFTSEKKNFLILDTTKEYQVIIKFKSKNNPMFFPIFVKAFFGGIEVFFHTDIKISNSSIKLS